MPKETKYVLTRDACYEELIRWAKGSLIPDAFFLAVISLIFVPLFVGCVFAAKYIPALGIILALACTVAPAFLVYKTVCDIIRLHLVKKGSFSIVRDTLSRISRGETPKNHLEGGQTVDVVYFTKYGRCASINTPFDLSGVGDEFYLVILHGKKDKIVFAYHSLMYECKDF